MLDGRPVDINIVDQPVRAPQTVRLLAADMEGTIIEQEMIDEIAGYIGKREEVSAITRAAMEGALDFEAALGERVALFAG